jgi:hypothetical protein
VDVHVDEAGEQCLAGRVDMANVIPPPHRARIGNAGDAAVIADEDCRIGNVATRANVEISVGRNDGLLGEGRRGERCQR